LIVASRADIDFRPGDLHDIQPGYAAENSGNVGRARVPNVLVGDDVDVGGWLRDGLLMASGDADGFFLFEQFEFFADRCRCCWNRRGRRCVLSVSVDGTAGDQESATEWRGRVS